MKLIDKPIGSMEALCNFCNYLLSTQYDIQAPMWELHFQENALGSNTTLLIWRFHHTFSDAHGITGMLLCLADNYSVDLFGGAKAPVRIIDKLLAIVLVPYYACRASFRSSFLRSDPTPISLKDNRHSGIKTCATTKEY